jgi:catechol 2,3-dioxygenase-like lactoylglutathione lyase family enzyme
VNLQAKKEDGSELRGPIELTSFAHVSLPCRDLEEGMRFYTRVLGGKLMFQVPGYAAVNIASIQIGLGDAGCSFIEPAKEYPHIAFYLTGPELVHMRRWLAHCGIPMTDLWTRTGNEALMFFRDPSRNLIELYCRSGYEGAAKLPRGDARRSLAADVEGLYYSQWSLPED